MVTPKTEQGSLIWEILSFSVKVFALLLVSLVPAFGAWVASSLTAYSNGPVWLALFAGLLLFPILPLAWDAYANVRRRKADKPRKRRLSHGTRIGLRILVMNGLVVAGLLSFAPQLAFTALSTRGDWMLDGRHGAWVEPTRRVVLASADRLAWLYETAHDNPYLAMFDKDQSEQDPVPPPALAVDAGESVASDAGTAAEDAGLSLDAGATPDAGAGADASSAPVEAIVEIPTPPPSASRTPWPFEPRLHSIVSRIPEAEEQSPDSVAKYISSETADPFERARAIHDYIADRIAYDAKSLARGEYPSFAPKVVLQRKKAVCAGYAALFAEMAKVAGLEAEVVVGYSRESEGELGNGDHAWNAVRLEGQWYLVDVTWDAGSVDGDQFEKTFRTDYFLTPPEIFILTHYPAKPKWQLLDQPVARGEFMRQPQLRPAFYASGLSLISPTRSQLTVEEPTVSLQISNARDIYLIVTASSKPRSGLGDSGDRCKLSYLNSQAHIKCSLPGPGTYQIQIFGGSDPLGAYPYLGHVEVNYRS